MSMLQDQWTESVLLQYACGNLTKTQKKNKKKNKKQTNKQKKSTHSKRLTLK